MANNFYSTSTILGMLDRAKENKKKQNKFQAPDFRQFAPQELKTDWEEEPLYAEMQNAVLSRSKKATEIALIKAQNLAAYKAMKRAQHQAAMAQQNQIQANQGGGGGTPQSGGYGFGSVPYGPIQEGSPFNINAGLVSWKWRNFTLTTNRSVADNFRGFLDALWRTGYRPKVIGSYADRNIAGTNTPSLHSKGLAIDIDPSLNPVTWNGVNVTALPPGVGALAARYGLKWGGSWTGSKRDTMHFSWPYGGVS